MAASTASVPFARLAQQRREQERELGLQDSCQLLATNTAAAFDMRMESASLNWVLLQQLNEAAAGEYGKVADVATALAQFSMDMGKRQASIKVGPRLIVPQQFDPCLTPKVCELCL